MNIDRFEQMLEKAELDYYSAVENAATDYIEPILKDISLRYPKRKIHLISGMGTLLINVDFLPIYSRFALPIDDLGNIEINRYSIFPAKHPLILAAEFIERATDIKGYAIAMNDVCYKDGKKL